MRDNASLKFLIGQPLNWREAVAASAIVKIDNKLTSPLTGEVATDNRTVKSGPGAQPAADPAGSVNVELSSLAEQLQSIKARLVAGESVDAAKVAEIRQAIADGRFRINPDAIAERLLQTVRELLDGTRKA